jgi:hypothetical protein
MAMVPCPSKARLLIFILFNLLPALGLLLYLTSTKVDLASQRTLPSPAIPRPPPGIQAERLRARFLPGLETLESACGWYNRTLREEAAGAVRVQSFSLEPRSR